MRPTVSSDNILSRAIEEEGNNAMLALSNLPLIPHGVRMLAIKAWAVFVIRRDATKDCGD